MRDRSVTYSATQEAAFQALADPTRRAVLDLLRRGSQPAGQIAGAFPVSRPAISKHLRLLRRAHLVREHREGRNRVYELNPEPLRAVDNWIEQYRVFWSANLSNLKDFVEAEYARETQATAKNQFHTNTNRTKERKRPMTNSTITNAIAKSLRNLLPLLLLATALAAHAQSDAEKAFATIKNMPGNWEGKGEDGQPLQVSFKVVSGGTAVMSEIQGDHAHDMISMFNLDGSRLLLTHYCSMGNQPRMQASVSPDGKTFTFNYVDATNLASPDAGHIQKMVLTVVDENHHTENWTFVDHGKEMNRFFDLHRQL